MTQWSQIVCANDTLAAPIVKTKIQVNGLVRQQHYLLRHSAALCPTNLSCQVKVLGLDPLQVCVGEISRPLAL